jgi:hypothetical protein
MSAPARQLVIPIAGSVLALIVAGCGPTQSLPTQTAPSGVAGLAYHHELNIQDGSDEHEYALEDGSLPPGLRLDEDGTIRGTPTRAGSYRFTLAVTGGGPGFVTSVFDVILAVLEPLTLDLDLSDAQVGVAYDETLTATGGTPPYAFEVVGLAAHHGRGRPPAVRLGGDRRPASAGSAPGARQWRDHRYADRGGRFRVHHPRARRLFAGAVGVPQL